MTDMLVLELFFALLAVLTAAGVAWSYLTTTPAERRAIRNADYIPPPVRENERCTPACCPCCGSARLARSTRGFRMSKALAGFLLAGGPVGANAGLLGSDIVTVTCLECGHRFECRQKP